MTANVTQIVMADRAGRDLSPEQNEALRPLVRRAVEMVGTQVALEREIGWDQAAISGFLSGRQGTSFAVALQICAMVGADTFDVLKLKRPKAALVAEGPSDLPVGKFLLKLRRMPGLEEWIEDHPEVLTVSQLARGMAIYDEVKPKSREDGQPFNGWDTFFDDALSGRLTAEKKVGDQPRAEALEHAQLAPGARRRAKR